MGVYEELTAALDSYFDKDSDGADTV